MLVWSVKLGKVSVDGDWRRLVVTSEELMSRFGDLGTSRQARVDEEVAGNEAELHGFTAVLGRSPNAGDENQPVRPGFGVERKSSREERKRRLGFMLGFL
jgi:hypothetical protein